MRIDPVDAIKDGHFMSIGITSPTRNTMPMMKSQNARPFRSEPISCNRALFFGSFHAEVYCPPRDVVINAVTPTKNERGPIKYKYGLIVVVFPCPFRMARQQVTKKVIVNTIHNLNAAL